MEEEKSRPLCSHKRIFTAPVYGTPETKAAQELCKRCPLLKDCARQALTAGSTTDRHVQRPASGVIQAGVFCTGDMQTALALAKIAGCDPPEIFDSTPRNAPPAFCKGCKKIMVKWQRSPNLKPGEVMHYARGFCTNCRVDYAREVQNLRTNSPSIYGHGRTRSRFDKPPSRPRNRTDQRRPKQMKLF